MVPREMIDIYCMNMALSPELHRNRTEIRAHAVFEIAKNSFWFHEKIRSTGGRQFANWTICIAFVLSANTSANTNRRLSKLILLLRNFIDDINGSRISNASVEFTGLNGHGNGFIHSAENRLEYQSVWLRASSQFYHE